MHNVDAQGEDGQDSANRKPNAHQPLLDGDRDRYAQHPLQNHKGDLTAVSRRHGQEV